MTAGKYLHAGAIVSPDRVYRYRLWRQWRDWDSRLELKTCVFIMLNPSTADHSQDDPTIRRCVAFSRSWGFDRLEVLNLFARRATDPKELLSLNDADNPVGQDNKDVFDQVLIWERRPITQIVCAWGAHGSHLGQDETALGWLGDCRRYALGLTKDGHPKHPLYVRADTPLVRFRP